MFDRENQEWPPPTSTEVVCTVMFVLRTDDPGYTAHVNIMDRAGETPLEYSYHELAYTIGGWAQAMSLVAWQLERARHYLQTFD